MKKQTCKTPRKSPPSPLSLGEKFSIATCVGGPALLAIVGLSEASFSALPEQAPRPTAQAILEPIMEYKRYEQLAYPQ